MITDKEMKQIEFTLSVMHVGRNEKGEPYVKRDEVLDLLRLYTKGAKKAPRKPSP